MRPLYPAWTANTQTLPTFPSHTPTYVKTIYKLQRLETQVGTTPLAEALGSPPASFAGIVKRLARPRPRGQLCRAEDETPELLRRWRTTALSPALTCMEPASPHSGEIEPRVDDEVYSLEREEAE